MAIHAKPNRVILALHFYDYTPYSVALLQLSARLEAVPGLWLVAAGIGGLAMALRIMKLSLLLRRACRNKLLIKRHYHSNLEWKKWCDVVLHPIIQSAIQLDDAATNKLLYNLSSQVPPETADALSKLSFTLDEIEAATKALKIFRVANPSQLDLISNLEKWIIEELPYFQQKEINADNRLPPPYSTNTNISLGINPEDSAESSLPSAHYDPLSAEDLIAFNKIKNSHL